MLGLMISLILAGIFISIAIYISVSGLFDNINKADVIVVLGNQVDPNGEPSPRLRARLDKAIQLYQQGIAPVIIVSGGIDPKGADEAQGMRSYLVKMNVPESSIYSDNQGDDTYKTARNVSMFLYRNKWDRVIVVSQFYHIARSRLALEQFGVPIVYSAHADFFELRDCYSLGREVIALIVYRVLSYE